MDSVVLNKSHIWRILAELQHTGRFFSATFIKKNKQVRTMVCMFKTGGFRLRRSQSNKQIVVYDVKLKDWRIVNLETLTHLSYNKCKFEIKEN